MKPKHLADVSLIFSCLLVIFLNLQIPVEGLDFCYDGSKEGYRLNSTVMKYVHAPSAVECVFLCVSEDESCRSINFRKASNSDKNCELLKDVDSERPELLLQDEKFDYFLLLDPNRKSPDSLSSNSSTHLWQNSSTNTSPILSCKELLDKNGYVMNCPT